MADDAGAPAHQRVVDDADGVNKFVGVFFLVAKAVDGDDLAGKIAVGQSRQEFLPTRLGEAGRLPRQFAVAERRAAEDQRLVGEELLQRRAADVDRRVDSPGNRASSFLAICLAISRVRPVSVPKKMPIFAIFQALTAP